MNWNNELLEAMLTEPSAALIEDIIKIKGSIGILGAGGKMGPTLALLAAKACEKAGIKKTIYAVSRFSDEAVKSRLIQAGISVISLDLLSKGAMARLPDISNIIYMAGRKFGTDGNEAATWEMNVSLPTLVARRFKGANIVVFSSGNIYPQVPVTSGGCTERVKPVPIGEYAMSTLGRERVFENAARRFDTKVLMYRLNYAVDLRYGVLSDIARRVMADQPIDLTTGNFNCVWQGYANEVAIRSILYCTTEPAILNVTGPETVSVRNTAGYFGRLFNKTVRFEGKESDSAYLNNADRCFELFGYPSVTLNQLIEHQAQWLKDGGELLDAPTHFEERKGCY